MSGKRGTRWYSDKEVCYDVRCAISSGANSLGAIKRITGYDYGTIKRHCKGRIKIPVGKKGRPKGTFKNPERIKNRDLLLKNGKLSLEKIAEKIGITRQGMHEYIGGTGQYNAWRQEREKYWKFRD